MRTLALILFLPMAAFANDGLKCKSFAGRWSRAEIQRVDSDIYNLQIRFRGASAENYQGKLELQKYRDRLPEDDSAYEEVYYSFQAPNLGDLTVDYVQTSDGEDYLYLKAPGMTSSLSCE